MLPVLVTSTNRRTFASAGHIYNSLDDYPKAMWQTAREENVPVIDLNAMSKNLYEVLGPEQFVKAFFHYPANTIRNQPNALDGGTHINTYGAYELAKCVVKGIRQNVPGLAAAL